MSLSFEKINDFEMVKFQNDRVTKHLDDDAIVRGKFVLTDDKEDQEILEYGNMNCNDVEEDDANSYQFSDKDCLSEKSSQSDRSNKT